MKPITDLADGSMATLGRLSGERAFRRRLMELGLIPGTAIRLLRINAVAGVVELEVRNCRVAVRSAEAAAMLVTAQ